MSAMANHITEKAWELNDMLAEYSANDMYWLLAEVRNAIDNGYGNKELTEIWFEWATRYDLAEYCVAYGAWFDDGNIESFLYNDTITREIMRTHDMYGKALERRTN